MEYKESAIQKSRTALAMQKNFMGIEGRFCTIVRELGDPILRSSSGDNMGLFHQVTNYLPDPFAEEPAMPTMSFGEMESVCLGYNFSGLSRGINLEILFLLEDRTITVRHLGQVVYREVEGQLFGYVPSEEFDVVIDKLFKEAKKKERRYYEASKAEAIARGEKKRAIFLEEMRKRWGL